MRPQRVDPIISDMGISGGHRLVLLSLEVYSDWADLRFARMETPGAPPLPRRVPRPADWSIRIDGLDATVVDAVGRGDRTFSNGEVRLQPAPSSGSRMDVSVTLAPGTPALTATVILPDPPPPPPPPGVPDG